MKIKRFAIYLSTLSIFFLASCGGGDTSSNNMDDTYGGFQDDYQMELTEEMDLSEGDEILMDRKLIKTASLSFEVEDLNHTSEKVHAAIKKHKAYISSEQEYTNYDREYITLDVRVPSQSFEAFMADISSGVEHFENKDISAQDVTEEFIDVEARIKTKKEIETQYIALLEKTESIAEILEIERHIGQIRGEIESAEGRLKYLESNTSYSVVSLSYFKIVEVPSKYGQKFKGSFGKGWDGFVHLLIGITTLWPFWVLLAFGYMTFRVLRKRSKLKKSNK